MVIVEDFRLMVWHGISMTDCLYPLQVGRQRFSVPTNILPAINYHKSYLHCLSLVNRSHFSSSKIFVIAFKCVADGQQKCSDLAPSLSNETKRPWILWHSWICLFSVKLPWKNSCNCKQAQNFLEFQHMRNIVEFLTFNQRYLYITNQNSQNSIYGQLSHVGL